MYNAVLTYGNGRATITGSDIIAVEISYQSNNNIAFENLALPDFSLLYNNNTGKAIFFQTGGNNQSRISDLFLYAGGDLKILSCKFVSSELNKYYAEIKPDMDYIKMIETNIEDMDATIGDMKTSYSNYKNIGQNIEPQKTIDYQQTLKDELVDLSGEIYEGYYHIDLKTGSLFSGEVPSENSVPLLSLRKIDILKKNKIRTKARGAKQKIYKKRNMYNNDRGVFRKVKKNV